jgi:ketosteroid isomerase-like protein
MYYVGEIAKGTRSAKARQHVVLLQHSPHCEGYSKREFLLLSNAKYLVQTLELGIEHSQEYQLFISRGGYMKRTILAAALLTVGCVSLPVLAQQQDLQEVMNATNALGARESELLGKKDAAGIAALFASDGLLVMLAPQFAFKPGREAIQKHYQGIIDAGATSITLELKNLELRSNDSIWAAGNYSVTVKDKTIQGNWFRILKRENGNWKIAMEAFARAGAIDAPPTAATSSPTPANSK